MIPLVTKKFKKVKAECLNCGDKLSAGYKEFISCQCYKVWQSAIASFISISHGIFIDGGDGFYSRRGGNPEDFKKDDETKIKSRGTKAKTKRSTVKKDLWN
jgi:hypothetical protein